MIDTLPMIARELAGRSIAPRGTRRVAIYAKPYRNSYKQIDRSARVGVYRKISDIKWSPRFYKYSPRNVERVCRAAKQVGIEIEFHGRPV